MDARMATAEHSKAQAHEQKSTDVDRANCRGALLHVLLQLRLQRSSGREHCRAGRPQTSTTFARPKPMKWQEIKLRQSGAVCSGRLFFAGSCTPKRFADHRRQMELRHRPPIKPPNTGYGPAAWGKSDRVTQLRCSPSQGSRKAGEVKYVPKQRLPTSPTFKNTL